jgi:hypothetical protein
LDVIVPRSSITPDDPDDADMKRSVIPLPRLIAPLNGRTKVVGGFCQELVAARVPSAETLRLAVSTCPLASDPLVHPRVLVRWTVNDQLPVACA